MTQALSGELPRPAGQTGGCQGLKPTGPRALSHPALTASRDALQAEWMKLRTTSGPAWLLAGIIGLTFAIGAAAVAANRCPAGMSCPVDTVKLSLTGIQLGQAVVAILAVLPVCNEYSTGMIRVTLAAMPRRTTVLAAKTGLVSGLVLPAGAVAVLGSLLAARLMLPGQGFDAAHGFTTVSLAHGSTLRAAAGSVLYLGLVALLSSGIAAMFRDPAPTIGVVLGVLYLFPLVVAFVGNPTWHRRLERYSPMAGLNIQATTGLKGLAIGLVALLGSGIAAMFRDPAPTIGVVLGVLYLFPLVTAFVGNPTWHRRLERYSPMAGLNIQATTSLKGLAIGPWAGLGVLAIWAAIALLAGGLTMALRDA